MLRVLQHYLPIRTALLVFSETILFVLVLAAGMTQHLWPLLGDRRGSSFASVWRALANEGMTSSDALLRCILSSILVAVLCQIAIGFNQLYDFNVSNSRYQRAARFVESAGVALTLAVTMVVVAYFWGLAPLLDFPGLTLTQRLQPLVVSLVAAFGLLWLWRNLYHWAMRRVNLNQRVLILGSRGPAHALAQQILNHPEAGYEVVALIPEPESEGSGRAASAEMSAVLPLATVDQQATEATEALVLRDFNLLGREIINKGVAMTPAVEGAREGESLLTLVRKHRIDLVIVSLENRRQTLPTEDLLRCRLAGVDVREREEIFEQITGKIAVSAMRPSYLIFNEGFRRHPWAALLKRTVDIVFSLLILLLTWPFMLLTAILVRIDTPGPMLFRQERVGQDGRPFTLMKFRSMRSDAEKDTGPVWSSANDPRITRTGRFMRKTRLDELPQLFNVLSGAMSLIGPRPERQHFISDLSKQIPYFQQRHIAKPGLTGWAQINYPYGNTVEDALHKLQYDLFYIKNQSLLFDLSILFNTIKIVVLRQGT